MKIIDTVKQPGYTQWIEGFVRNTLKNANISAAETIITDMYNRRIYLTVDGQEYMIHTVSFRPVGKDVNGIICSENVEYTLYIGQEGCDEIEDPISLPERSTGTQYIEWSNDVRIYKEEVNQYIALHGEPKKLADPQEGEYIALHVEDCCQGSWDLHMDIRSLSDEEVLAAIDCLTTGEIEEEFYTPKMMRYLNEVHEHCAKCLLDFCFQDNVYNHAYAVRLISACSLYKLCCTMCAFEKFDIVSRLYEEYQDGDEAALDTIKICLYDFFKETKPYCISVI